jgi:hypothetical protein
LRVAQGCRNEALLISQLVALALDGMRSVMIWETINAGTIDAGMLERVQGELANIDLQAGMLSAVRAELAGALDAIEWIAEGGVDPSMLSRPDGTASRTVALTTKAAPTGWINQNRAYMANWYLDYVILPMRDSELSDVLVKAGELETLLMETKEGGMHPHKIMPLIAMPVISSIIGKVIHAEANRQMQILACALERHRLDTGDYPDALDALVPKYIETIPADPCAPSDDPIHYEKVGTRYRLWSIALDCESDGGTVDKTAKRLTSESYDGDWVWRFAK